MSNAKFSPVALEECKRIMGHFPAGKEKSAILPILHIAQAENDGWLSAGTMDAVAVLIGIQPIEVYEVASFYSMFHLEPVGKCVLEVCRTVPCWLRGSEQLVEYLEEKLNIQVGQTTQDGMFTLKTVECLGSCGTAPMLQCGADYFENLTNEKADALIDRLKNLHKRKSYTDMPVESSI